MTAFIEYVLKFYGDAEDSLGYFANWGHQPMTRAEAEQACQFVAERESYGGGGSFDREVVRDVVLAARGVPLTDLEYGAMISSG